MSRRLDISALLCNDDDDDDKPHIAPRPSSSSSPALARQPPPSFPALHGLDALVQAATEESRRLSAGDLQHHLPRPQIIHQQQQQQQPHHHHQQQQPPTQQRLSPQIRRSPWQDDQQYLPQHRQQPQSPRHPTSPVDAYKSPPQRHVFEDRNLQMRQFQHMEEQKRQHDLERLRQQQQQQQELERQRFVEQELERAKLERQKMEAERRLMKEERMRYQALQRQLTEREEARLKEEAERDQRRRSEEEHRHQEEVRRREREVAAIHEAERRERQRQEEVQRKQDEQRRIDMQRAAEMEHRRQMQHQQMVLLQQHQEQEREFALRHHQQQQAHSQQQQQQQQQQRSYEAPHRIEIPPGPQHPPRKHESSPPSKAHSHSPVLSHVHPDQRPAKKARYTDSPSLPPILMDDKDRITRERERMTVGEIGYGRIESPVAVPSSSSSSTPAAPRRPGSGSGVRRPVSVSDLLSPEPQPHLLPTPIEPHHPPLRIISREKDPAAAPHHHHHRIVSPLGRRSPPGSQVGRAKAARKSDEHASSSYTPMAHSASSSSTASASLPPVVSHQHPPPPPPSSLPSLPAKKLVVKEEQVTKRQKLEEMPSPMLAEPLRKAPSHLPPAKESPTTPISSLPPSQSARRHSKERSQAQPRHDDAHDWLLEHYAENSSTSEKDRRQVPQQKTRSPPASSQRRTVSPVVQVKQQSHSPVIEDEDDNALEKELEKLLAEVDTPEEEEENMDVDSLVTDLVAGTLDGDDEEDEPVTSKSYQRDEPDEPMPLAADVEDELLSLIDDKPPPPSSTSVARRASGSSTTATPMLAPPTSRIIKPAPPPVKTSEAGTHPLKSPASDLMSPAGRLGSAKPKPERESMPPPPMKDRDQDSQKDTSDHATPSSSAAPSKKKKESSGHKKPKGKATMTEPAGGPSNAADVSETTVKPRTKVSKAKKAATPAVKVDSSITPAPQSAPSTSKSAIAKSSAAATVVSRKNPSASRSRSTSVMPNALVDETPTRGSSVVEDKAVKAQKDGEEEEEESAADEDDRLYCVCKTKYDQERCMIACDRCDEWYHMQCVDMPENVADLVDQFFCPICIEKNPGLNLRSTYKQRCLWGLKNPDPSSPRACHKPARGAFSKYCSDECGVKYMQSRIDTWAKKGGKKDKLWDSVKNAERREGVVVRVDDKTDGTSAVNGCKLDAASKPPTPSNGYLKPAKPVKSKAQREKERLAMMLEQLVQTTSELKKGMEILAWREKLLELAGERADSVSQCGWDQRLCYGDEEWAEHGQSVLESYEDRQDADMDVDGQSDVEEGDWWCTEDTGCSRHMGWQATRYKDICKEKERKEEALQKITHRETEFRKRLYDISNPQLNKHAPGAAVHVKDNVSKPPHLASAISKLANGHSSKGKGPGGDALKKGKKRKAPAS